MTDKASVIPKDARRPKHRTHNCERRGSKRLLCSDLVRVSWFDPDGYSRTEVAILENLSLSGVGLFLGVQVPQGSLVEMAAHDTLLKGAVRSCQYRENGYIVGIELDADSRWAQEPNSGFVPEHLLDVSLLVLD